MGTRPEQRDVTKNGKTFKQTFHVSDGEDENAGARGKVGKAAAGIGSPVDASSALAPDVPEPVRATAETQKLFNDRNRFSRMHDEALGDNDYGLARKLNDNIEALDAQINELQPGARSETASEHIADYTGNDDWRDGPTIDISDGLRSYASEVLGKNEAGVEAYEQHNISRF